jgi:cytochrome c553
MLALLAAQGWAGSVAPVVIYTDFENRPPTPIFESLKKEVDSLMAPLKVPLEWRQLPSRELDRPASLLAVVTFKGACDARDALLTGSESGPLAWTHITDGEILPFAEVDCGRIRQVMGRILQGQAVAKRQATFGRALGRVMSHELYHIFTHTRHHGNDDVARPAYTGLELASDRFAFGLKELKLLRSSLTPVLRALRTSMGLPLRSAQAGRSLYELSSCGACHGDLGEGKGAAPSLRPLAEKALSNAFAAKLDKGLGRMYKRPEAHSVAAPPLNSDDIDDIVSYLNSVGQGMRP